MVSGIQDVKQKNMDTGSDNLSNQFSSEQSLKISYPDHFINDPARVFHEITSARHLNLNSIFRNHFSRNTESPQPLIVLMQAVNNFINNKHLKK